MMMTSAVACRMEVNFTSSGGSVPEVHWFFDGKEIENSDDFQITHLSQKTILVIPEAFADDSGTFTVRLINSDGGMTETTCILSVKGKFIKAYILNLRILIIKIIIDNQHSHYYDHYNFHHHQHTDFNNNNNNLIIIIS